MKEAERYKFLVIRKINSRDLIYNMINIIATVIFFMKVIKSKS